MSAGQNDQLEYPTLRRRPRAENQQFVNAPRAQRPRANDTYVGLMDAPVRRRHPAHRFFASNGSAMLTERG